MVAEEPQPDDGREEGGSGRNGGWFGLERSAGETETQTAGGVQVSLRVDQKKLHSRRREEDEMAATVAKRAQRAATSQNTRT